MNICYNLDMSAILEKLSHVPQLPGVYLMKDNAGHIIYVGKAKSLKNRLGSYFHSGSHDAKVTAMLAKVVSFDYFIVKTEKDALGLEANLIKKHKPHYNILLKDNKSFPYIKIVDAPYPYLESTRKITAGGKYFGPFFNGIWARDLLRMIADVFPVRSCGGALPKKECMNYQMGRCSGPCIGAISKEDYSKIIEDVKSFLKGEKEHGAREVLQQKMETAAEMQQFEIAIRYRTSLEFLDKLKERTITQVGRDVNCDIFGFAALGGVFVVSVLTVRAGKLIGIQNFANENKQIQTEEEMLAAFIMQFYTANIVPELIVSRFALEELAEALNCKIFNPKAALKKQLLELADTNAQEYIEKEAEKIKFKHEFTMGACEELGKVLNLPVVPKKIECYDISNLFGEEQVASMVVFIDGRAEPKLYRRFRIRTVVGADDYKSMNEVLTRRLARLETEDPSFGTPPDLVIIDGGKGQLSSALEALGKTTQKWSVISLAEKNEEVFVPNNSDPIVLSRRSYSLRLLQRVRDEAHRFAITYHKNLRDKKNAQQFKKRR